MRKSIIFTALLFLVLYSGCCHFDAYALDRGNDFVDIFTLKAGGGLGIHSGFNLGGLINVCAGISKTFRAGFEGRRYVREEHILMGAPFYNFIVPVVSIFRGDFMRYDNPALGTVSVVMSVFSTGADKIYTNPKKPMPLIHGFGQFSSADTELWFYSWGQYLGLNEPVENPLSRGWRDYDLRVYACFFVAVEAGINPVELLDFLVGLVGFDIMDDDNFMKERLEKVREKREAQTREPTPQAKP